MRRGIVASVLLGLLWGSHAQASFESFPGRDSGGTLDSACRGFRLSRGSRNGVSLSVEGGRPAPVEGLLWSHARIGYARQGLAADLEAYVQSLDGAYRESLLGLWLECAGVATGIRSWRVTWAGFQERSGTTMSFMGRRDLGRWIVGATLQDLPLGMRDEAGPTPYYALAGGLRLGPLAEVAAGWRHEEDLRGPVGLVTLYPVPELGISHGFRYPGPRWRSGIEVRRSAWIVRLWVEPDALRGTSVVWSVSYR